MENGELLKEKKNVITVEKKESLKLNEGKLSQSFKDEHSQGHISDGILQAVPVNAPKPLSEAAVRLAEQEPFFEEKREPVVALDGRGHQIDNGFLGIFGGDGYFMKKIKGLTMEEDLLRYEGLAESEEDEEGFAKVNKFFYPVIDYDEADLRGNDDIKLLNKAKSRFSSLVNYCRMYRYTHPWPFTKEGKARKADVVKLEAEAKKRLKVCNDRLRELNKKTEELSLIRKDKGRNVSVTDAATSGGYKLLAYTRTFLFGMTVRNTVNTAAFFACLAPWLVATGVRSLIRGQYAGAFSMPVPHLPGTWYNFYTQKNFRYITKKKLDDIGKRMKGLKEGSKEYRELEAELEKLRPDLAAESVPKGYWTSRFAGDTFEHTGYTNFNDDDIVNYNDSAKI